MPEEKVSELNIYQKLERIRKPADVLKKDKSGYGYMYVSEADILAKIKAGMEKYHVSLIPQIVPGTFNIKEYSYSKNKFTKDGKCYQDTANEILVSAEMIFLWVNNDNPEEKITVPFGMVGQQSDASQAFGSGLTYANRYFLLKYFNIATDEDDPEVWMKKKKEVLESEKKEILSSMIEEINTLVKEYIKDKEENKKVVEELIKAHHKPNGKPSANYLTIKEPAVAAEILTEMKKLTEGKE